MTYLLFHLLISLLLLVRYACHAHKDASMRELSFFVASLWVMLLPISAEFLLFWMAYDWLSAGEANPKTA